MVLTCESLLYTDISIWMDTVRYKPLPKGPGTTIKDPIYSRESTNERGREMADYKVRQVLYQGSSEGETYVPGRGGRTVHP